MKAYKVTVNGNVYEITLEVIDKADIKALYEKKYQGPIVNYTETMDESGFISGAGASMKDDMQISVFGNAERILLVARYDDLGKGASGAAIQKLNMVLGADITEGLDLGK